MIKELLEAAKEDYSNLFNLSYLFFSGTLPIVPWECIAALALNVRWKEKIKKEEKDEEVVSSLVDMFDSHIDNYIEIIKEHEPFFMKEVKRYLPLSREESQNFKDFLKVIEKEDMALDWTIFMNKAD